MNLIALSESPRALLGAVCNHDGVVRVGARVRGAAALTGFWETLG
jgi:hypothetical protein